MIGKKCVSCGYCCRKVPCSYGTAGDNGGCIHLTEDNRCGIYEDILKIPSWRYTPAFGQGCGSALFNDIRKAVIDEKYDGNEQWQELIDPYLEVSDE